MASEQNELKIMELAKYDIFVFKLSGTRHATGNCTKRMSIN